MKIGITADCSSGLEYAPFEHNVKITRTTINFGEKVLIDGIDIKADEFYNLLESSEVVPTTSAPSIGEIQTRINEWKSEGCTDVIHFPISTGLSPYGANLSVLRDELFEDINVHFFPSKQVCIMQGYLAHYAEILIKQGKNVAEIIDLCSQLQDQIHAYFIVDDLKYLVKNGRLTLVSGFIGSLINIKPILEVNNEGKIVPFEKVRTKARAILRMEDIIVNSASYAKKVIYVVLHANRLDEANKIAEDIRLQTNNAVRTEVVTITPTVGAHIGSGLLGIATIVIDNLPYNDLI